MSLSKLGFNNKAKPLPSAALCSPIPLRVVYPADLFASAMLHAAPFDDDEGNDIFAEVHGSSDVEEDTYIMEELVDDVMCEDYSSQPENSFHSIYPDHSIVKHIECMGVEGASLSEHLSSSSSTKRRKGMVEAESANSELKRSRP